MSACHTKPFVLPGVVVDTAGAHAHEQMKDEHAGGSECCDYCGSAQLQWRKCKLICVDCRQINKSCADL